MTGETSVGAPGGELQLWRGRDDVGGEPLRCGQVKTGLDLTGEIVPLGRALRPAEQPEPTVAIGASVSAAQREAGHDGWTLVVDPERHPLGWVRPAVLPDDGSVDEGALALGGTLATAGGPLRVALDAALSSPSRRGVVVDDDGVLMGTCLATEVLDVIESRDRPRDPGAEGD